MMGFAPKVRSQRSEIGNVRLAFPFSRFLVPTRYKHAVGLFSENLQAHFLCQFTKE